MTKQIKKWTRNFWIDWGERVGTTFLYGLVVLIGGESLQFDHKQIMAVLIIPTMLSAIKGLLKNMTSTSEEPTASLVNVSSTPVD